MGRKYSAAQNKATQKYIKSAYDTISLRVRKGEKEVIQEHADGQGESMNAFINRAISEQMERDKGEQDGEIDNNVE